MGTRRMPARRHRLRGRPAPSTIGTSWSQAARARARGCAPWRSTRCVTWSASSCHLQRIATGGPCCKGGERQGLHPCARSAACDQLVPTVLGAGRARERRRLRRRPCPPQQCARGRRRVCTLRSSSRRRCHCSALACRASLAARAARAVLMAPAGRPGPCRPAVPAVAPGAADAPPAHLTGRQACPLAHAAGHWRPRCAPRQVAAAAPAPAAPDAPLRLVQPLASARTCPAIERVHARQQCACELQCRACLGGQQD